MKIDVTVRTDVSNSARVKQLGGMFDVPPSEKSEISWQGDFPYEDEPWNVGLIVGPSGCGKSTIMREAFGSELTFDWPGKSVVDDFDDRFTMKEVTGVCQAVGFNTVPAWTRPYKVLSNGERFRVDLARRLLESDGIIVVDEFTSVVDRQVAKIASHAVQKHVRRTDKQFVAASCHHDVIDWLQPDWVLEPATMRFRRRSVQRRPSIDVVVGRVPRAAWKLFAPFHYMSASLNSSANCYGLWAEGALVAFCAVLPRPHPKVKNVFGVSRTVTLPDWQGVGFNSILVDTVAAAYKARGKRFRHYPAHPALIGTLNRSPRWAMVKRPGTFSPTVGKTSGLRSPNKKGSIGNRPCGVFEYVGDPLSYAELRVLLGDPRVSQKGRTTWHKRRT